MERVDRLTPVFERFPPEARVQFAGHLRGTVDVDVTKPVGHIHWLKSGELIINNESSTEWLVDQPSIVFVPGATPHTLKSTHGAELVCSQFEFGHRFHNPLIGLKPAVLILPIADVPEIATVHGLMTDEAFSERCGKSVAASHLLNYALLVLFRHIIKNNTVKFGPLKALGDGSIQKAVTKIHRNPTCVDTRAAC